MAKRPPCQGTRRDGSPCNTYAETSGLCKHHEQEKARLEQLQAEAANEPDEPAATPKTEKGNARGTIRERLDRDPDAIANALFDLLSATKGVKHDCTHCGKRNIIELPNPAPIVSAAEKLLDQGYGKRTETKQDDQATEAEALLDALNAMTDEQLTAELDKHPDLALAHAIIHTTKTPN